MAKKNGTSSSKMKKMSSAESLKVELKMEREKILLWKRPFTTIQYSVCELVHIGIDFAQRLMTKKLYIAFLSLIIGILTYLYNVDGPHQPFVQSYEKYILWCIWWVGLGVLSSVGLGTGLHTFILYLGPHIAAVTMAAYECGSTDFPEPPYPDSIVCPTADSRSEKALMTVWQIMSKVRVECICWGAGTALGELPPYFVARAHRLSDCDSDNEDDEFQELQDKRTQDPSSLNIFDKAKLGVERIVEKVGFMGILACASIPNPLFDLAGITCGHFLVPFWTFFGATLIGKAIIKMHIQKLFIIMSFNEKLIAGAIEQIQKVPYVGSKIEGPFKDFLRLQKEKLHSGSSSGAESAAQPQGNILSEAFGKLVMLMIFYFIVSIVNSLAQNYHKRIHKKVKDK